MLREHISLCVYLRERRLYQVQFDGKSVVVVCIVLFHYMVISDQKSNSSQYKRANSSLCARIKRQSWKIGTAGLKSHDMSICDSGDEQMSLKMIWSNVTWVYIIKNKAQKTRFSLSMFLGEATIFSFVLVLVWCQKKYILRYTPCGGVVISVLPQPRTITADVYVSLTLQNICTWKTQSFAIMPIWPRANAKATFKELKFVASKWRNLFYS